jgi:GR25 family glycosyltransferase involved in LPS biosynthesis
MNHLFEHTLYINLDSRLDRNEQALKQFESMGITAQRVSGIDTSGLIPKGRPGSPGMLGCGLSHLKCLKLAKENNWDYVFICEDDAEFINPSLLKENLQKFLNDPRSPDWDVILLGGNLQPSPRYPNIKLNDYSVRVRKAFSTVAYIIKNRYFDTLIRNFTDSTNALSKDMDYTDAKNAIDVSWIKLQLRDTFIMIIPPTVIQFNSYSDITRQDVNYSDELLNIEKGL